MTAPTTLDLARMKLTKALTKAGVTKAATADLVELKSNDFQFDAAGKLRNKAGLSPKKYARSLRDTRPEIFGAPAAADDTGVATNTAKLKNKNNPFANIPANVDPVTGKFNSKALKAQYDLTRALPIDRVAGIAKAAGVKLGDARPATRKYA